MQYFKGNFLLYGILTLFFLLLLIGVRNHSQSWYFQDETEHVAVGWMVAQFNRQLYFNLSTNHQPLPVLAGAMLAKVIPYTTLFELIDRIRVSMWAFAFLGSLLMTWRFKWRGLMAVLLTYSLGHYFLAWQVLAESLGVPAVLWLMLLMTEKMWLLDESNTQLRRTLDSIISGLAIFWLGFTLLPLWPFAFLSLLVLGWFAPIQERKWLIGSIVLPTLLLFCWFNPFDWWRETIVNNVFYFIPYEAGHDQWHYLRLLGYPIFHLFSLKSPIARFYLVFIGLVIVLGLTKKPHIRWSKKLGTSLTVMIVLLFLLNPRVSELNVSFYRGFHLFPYVAGVSVVVSTAGLILFSRFSSSSKNKVKAYSLVALGTLLLINNSLWLLQKPDKLSEYYINYDTFQAYGNALSTISQPGDTLMTGSDGSGYMNMMARLPFAGKQNFHLEWAYRTPDLRAAWFQMIAEHPPTFVYFNLSNDSYSQVLTPLLEKDYVALPRADGSPTRLQIRKDALPLVNQEQWQKFEEQAFLRPTLD